MPYRNEQVKRTALFLLLISVASPCFAQTAAIDSLRHVLEYEKNDSARIQLFNMLSDAYEVSSNSDSSLYFAGASLSLAQKINSQKGMARAYNLMGNTYDDIGNYPAALDCYLKALNINEKIGSQHGIAANSGNIGLVYCNENDFEKAIGYYRKAISIYRSIGDSNGVAVNAGNIGNALHYQGKYPEAIRNYFDALSIYKQAGDSSGIATNTGNVANVYDDMGEHQKALQYYFRARSIILRSDDVSGLVINTGNIGECYLKLKNYSLAEKYLRDAIASSDSIHFTEGIKGFNGSLSELYRQTGQWQKAYSAFVAYSIAKDSLVNEDKSKTIGRLEAKSDYDKQLARQQAADDKQLALQKADQNKKAALAEAESKQQKIMIGCTAAVALAVAIIAFVIFRSLRITREQKNLIEKQKMVVEEKNKEILDSITYAKRLQDAILPPEQIVKKYLPDSFILYKPRDIVAGDFYWMEVAGNKIFIAAADCTGHGVPGAMVSVVCSNALNRSVKEFQLTDPGKILDKTRELVLEVYEKSEGEIKDGMDISFCVINTATHEIQWSGANNPLWYIRDGSLEEIAADKQPIGKYEMNKPFSSTAVRMKKGDSLFLITDGFADQFGGPRGKKFKYRPLKEKLVELNGKKMEEQREQLENIFEAWKGDLQQTDDVCIIGVRL